MINLINVNKTNLLPKVKKLYLTAFPDYERVPYWILFYKSKKKSNDCYALYDDNTYVRMLY